MDISTGNWLGPVCDRQVELAPGDMVKALVIIYLEDDVAAGEYSFITVFGAVGGTGDVAILPPSGMVSWWPGDGHSMDIINGNHGTLTGDATYTGGMVGQAFSFDGSGDFVVVPDDPSLNITGDVTVDLWARRTVFGGSEDAFMGAKGADPFGTSDQPVAYALVFGTGDELLAGFQVADGTAYGVLGPIVTDSISHHYAYVRSGDTLKLFMDGVDVTVVTFISFTDRAWVVTGDGSFIGSPSDTSGLPLTIGARRADPDPLGFMGYFGGVIDEVEVFSRALSNAEVRAIYDAGSAGKVKPAPVVFREDGESCPGGTQPPGWDIFDGPESGTVLCSTSVKKVGTTSIAVTRDNMIWKNLPGTFTGSLSVSLWMFPTPDHNTNNNFVLGHQTEDGAVEVRVNESHRWFLSTDADVIADYSGTWTFVQMQIDTVDGTLDVWLDGTRVVANRSISVPQGFNRIGVHSGRGGTGHTSYFDELIISSP